MREGNQGTSTEQEHDTLFGFPGGWDSLEKLVGGSTDYFENDPKRPRIIN